MRVLKTWQVVTFVHAIDDRWHLTKRAAITIVCARSGRNAQQALHIVRSAATRLPINFQIGETIMDIKQNHSTPTRRSARVVSPSALAVVIALATSSVFAVAQAATVSTATAATAAVKTSGSTDALLKFSQAGRDAFDNVRLARVDLFNGRTDAAIKEMKAAQVALIAAKAEAPTFTSSAQEKVMGKVLDTTKQSITADAVPVGGDLVLDDNFQLSPKHQPVLAKAKEQLAKGDKKAAIEVLKQGNIDVSYNRLWLPMASSEKNLDKAINLATSKHYYGANLALKSIEDGL